MLYTASVSWWMHLEIFNKVLIWIWSYRSLMIGVIILFPMYPNNWEKTAYHQCRIESKLIESVTLCVNSMATQDIFWCTHKRKRDEMGNDEPFISKRLKEKYVDRELGKRDDLSRDNRWPIWSLSQLQIWFFALMFCSFFMRFALVSRTGTVCWIQWIVFWMIELLLLLAIDI